MSKDEKEAAEGRRKRRRKGGGLRVPSDNVPRRTIPEDIAPQSADDPRLAVSVAYAFQDKGSGERELSAEEAATIPEEPGEMRDVDESDELYDPAEVAEVAEVAEAPQEVGSDSVDIAFDEDEEVDLAKTIVSEDDGEPEPEPKPESKAASPKGNKWPRVQTEALTDGDLELMMRAAGDAGETVNTEDLDEEDLVDIDELDAEHLDHEGLDDDEVDEDEIPTAVNAPAPSPDVVASAPTEPKAMAVPAVEMTGVDTVPVMPPPAPPPSVPTAVESLEKAMGDSSDSGPHEMEISSSDLEEVSEEQVAAKAPPPAPAKNSAGSAAAAAAAKGAPKPRKRKAKPWFEEIFDEDYLRTLPFLTPQATQSEANFVIESLASETGSQILDVGCGYGRHAMELAARGYHVVGLDSSLPLLLRGADEAQRRGLTINFVHGDMRELSFEAQFDGAYCLFSTFGYFDDETNKRTAQNIGRALKPGARMVVEILNRDYLIGDLPSRVWWEGDGCVVLEEVEFNYFSSRLASNRSVVFDDGRQLEQEISIRAYSLHEIGKLLHSAGFRVIEVSGGMHMRGRFFGAQSRDIVVVAERRAPKADGRAVTEL